MLFLDKKEILNVLQCTHDEYEKVISPIEDFIIDFNRALEDVSQESKIYIHHALYHLRNKLIFYERLKTRIANAMLSKQYHVMSMITTESELIINNQNPENNAKICFNKKNVKNEAYKGYKFLDITKTQTAELAKMIVIENYKPFFENEENFKDINGKLYDLEDLSFRISILKNIISFLNGLNYDIK